LASAMMVLAMVSNMLGATAATPVGILVAVLAVVLAVFFASRRRCEKNRQSLVAREKKTKRNVVVNYHFHRVCNYKCKFCFHTAKNKDMASLADAQKAVQLLQEVGGMTRINFSGGEPFLKHKWLGEMCRYCKAERRLDVSIVSNGSKVSRRWFEKYAQFLDVLAISCDSFDERTLEAIGRGERSTDHLRQLELVRGLCEEFDVVFKINTVVCTPNVDENMVEHIRRLRPQRWKVRASLERPSLARACS
jgi:molybdenum cofactor biosynthesis enzyme MoaA